MSFFFAKEKDPDRIDNDTQISDAEWQTRLGVEGTLAFPKVTVLGSDDMNRDGVGRRRILNHMLPQERVRLEVDWEDVYVLSKMGRIGRAPTDFIYPIKAGMDCLARLTGFDEKKRPLLDVLFSPTESCHSLCFAITVKAPESQLPIICAPVDIEQKYFTKEEPKGEKGKGEFYVNYFDKTIGQVPDELTDKIASIKPVKKAFIAAGRSEEGLLRIACLY